jgi:magnesium-protoporphyrin O-methyltransferase
MSRCCNARGCDEFFGARYAARVARRYRKKGLDKTAQRIVTFLASQGIEAATVLEIGGGVGEIEIELLRRGASHAVNLELSPRTRRKRSGCFPSRVSKDGSSHACTTWPPTRRQSSRRISSFSTASFAATPTTGAARRGRGHARRFIVFSYPPRHALSRLFIGAQNLVFTLRRREFRTFAHPPEAMLRVVEDVGFHHVFAHRAPVWQIASKGRDGRRRAVAP